MITVSDLSVTFGRGRRAVPAVQRVSFAVEAGGLYGIVGESGSGKSTILNVLSGLNRRWRDSVTIDGDQQAMKRDLAFHKKVQMVFQDPYGSLHPRHTVDRILSEPVAIHGLGQAEERILRALEEVGLQPHPVAEGPGPLGPEALIDPGSVAGAVDGLHGWDNPQLGETGKVVGVDVLGMLDAPAQTFSAGFLAKGLRIDVQQFPDRPIP